MSTLFKKHILEISDVSEVDLDYVLSHFVLKEFKKNEFITRENQTNIFEYFVLSGCLKSYNMDQNGKEHIVQFGLQNWWISDYQAYFSSQKASLNIDCVEDSQVLELTLENREKLCAEMHAMEHFFRVKTTKGYIALQQRILSMLNNNPQERYNLLLSQNPSLFQKVPKKLIASYLGVSRETLSRF
jgi:CRP-like cAMP-binding protein